MYRIMMIEDDEKIRTIVADTLKKWQYDVVEVTEFDQVITEFKQSDPLSSLKGHRKTSIVNHRLKYRWKQK